MTNQIVLGEKKRKKVLAALKECDLVLLVIDPASPGLPTGNLLLKESLDEEKQILIVYNLFTDTDEAKIAGLEETFPELKQIPKICFSALRIRKQN